jgi:hypothetical protein
MKALVAVVVFGLLPSALFAQDRFPPQAGTRVRVSAPRFYLFHETGTVNGTDRFGVDLNLEDYGEDIQVPYPDIARLEVSRGRTRMTWVGALGGAALGLVLGAVTTPIPDPDRDDLFAPPSGGDPVPRMALGALVGGFVGGLVGSAVEMERWEPVFAARRRF